MYCGGGGPRRGRRPPEGAGTTWRNWKWDTLNSGRTSKRTPANSGRRIQSDAASGASAAALWRAGSRVLSRDGVCHSTSQTCVHYSVVTERALANASPMSPGAKTSHRSEQSISDARLRGTCPRLMCGSVEPSKSTVRLRGTHPRPRPPLQNNGARTENDRNDASCCSGKSDGCGYRRRAHHYGPDGHIYGGALKWAIEAQRAGQWSATAKYHLQPQNHRQS